MVTLGQRQRYLRQRHGQHGIMVAYVNGRRSSTVTDKHGEGCARRGARSARAIRV